MQETVEKQPNIDRTFDHVHQTPKHRQFASPTNSPYRGPRSPAYSITYSPYGGPCSPAYSLTYSPTYSPYRGPCSPCFSKSTMTYSPTRSPTSLSSSDFVRAGHVGDGVADERLAVHPLQLPLPEIGHDVASYVARFHQIKQDSDALSQEWGGRRDSWTRVYDVPYGSTSMHVAGQVPRAPAPRGDRGSPVLGAPPSSQVLRQNLRRTLAEKRI